MDKTSHIYEVIIIGAGPAGITAAIYCARKKMDFLVLTTNMGGQVAISSQIENYMGFQYITGEELTTHFQNHLKKYKFELNIEEVKKIEREKNLFRVKTDIGKYFGKTVIVATGRKPRELNVPGEHEFKYRGVAYCATCDAPLFEGLSVAVIGGGNAGFEAVLQLAKIAKSVTLIEISQRLKADAVLIEKARESNKVKIWTNTRVTKITGDNTVTGLKIQRNGKESTLPVQGVFVEIGSVSNSDIIDFAEKNRWNEIIVNCRCETNISGLFAAGDVTNAPEKQIVVAAGDGCKAALQAFKFISRIKE